MTAKSGRNEKEEKYGSVHLNLSPYRRIRSTGLKNPTANELIKEFHGSLFHSLQRNLKQQVKHSTD